jgi:NAD(P)-dependent dehydrogenase (short-subunit alcohol dehydrogenase family)
MPTIDLSSQTILITGGLGAIAEHVVRRLHETGAHLVVTDAVPEPEAVEKLQSWGLKRPSFDYCQMDVTDSDAVERTVNQMMDKYPNLDTVLGHAGGCALHPFLETSEAEFERIFRFNYLAQVYLARVVLKRWTAAKTAGHLVFTSSYVAAVPHTRIPAYATAKAALDHLVKCLALEMGPAKIRVNAISPGNVAAGSSLKVYDEDREYREFVDRVSPLGKRNSPEGVADVFVMLCSPLSREINGQVISVDMGVSIPKIG